MSLLGDLEQKLVGGGQGDLLHSVSNLIAGNGGLSGVINRFEQSGLGQHAQSWIGNGQNMPITGDHIGQVFGADQVQQVAQQLGVDATKASNLIAGILPTVIDKLTPHGQMVNNDQAQQGLASMISKGISSIFGQK